MVTRKLPSQGISVCAHKSRKEETFFKPTSSKRTVTVVSLLLRFSRAKALVSESTEPKSLLQTSTEP